MGTDMNSIGVFDGSGRKSNIVGTSATGFGFDVPTTVSDTTPFTVMAGDTRHFQDWHRDNPAGTSNFSIRLSVDF